MPFKIDPSKHTKCPICMISMYIRPKAVRKYYSAFQTCSRECRKVYESRFHPRKGRPFTKKGKTIITKNCLQCNIVFTFQKHGNVERKKFCSKQCLYKHNSENYRGENSYSWKGGISKKLIRYGSDFESAKKIVLKRDRYQCVECESTSKIEVHHINGVSKDNSLINLVSLCENHHYDKHRERLRERAKSMHREGIL